jgi:dCTP deaminase
MRFTHRVGLDGKNGQQLGRRSVWRGSQNCIKKASRRIVPAGRRLLRKFRRQDDDALVVSRFHAQLSVAFRGRHGHRIERSRLKAVTSARLFMAILCDTQIRELIGIEPFEDNVKRPGKISYGVSSYGYDLRVGAVFKIFTNINSQIVDPKKFSEASFVTIDCDEVGKDHVLIPPNSFALCETVETVEMPRGYLAICVGKSTYARCGIIVNVTPIEPEWRGKITLEISNTTPLPAKIYANEGIAQLIFLQGDRVCATSYADKSGKYQDQRGLTLPRVD